ncbi:hypothetical protein DI09_37p160 [Mitosporidium daphniae]|uniref:RRM domain-containing protein n=1 Tax=Mitosporidium daphniae TaxID=1485682 RepID=A0A098VRH7_9MICR|nr:uncharacterized protein DI09_37p160 [Mitosporidium daphniae]KGG51379.1 hypothetical protein DI09_37p160 [Mitosporidium daphniae]|eukprot:XP_013237806.1 uncharacterized protein DI09_37p160 [Mitosporidium daphniae]
MSWNIDELDALLEAPFQEKQLSSNDKLSGDTTRSSSPSPSKGKSRYQDDDYFRSPRPSSSTSSSSKRDYSRERPSASKERTSDPYSRRRRRSRSRSRCRVETAKRDDPPSGAIRKRARSPSPELTEGERDRRTVFVQQLAVRLRETELREFFSKVGKVRQVKIVSDRITGRSKGFGYVEFRDEPSVPLAILLSGHKLLGIPILVSNTETEKNRLAEEAAAMCSSRSSSESARTILPPPTQNQPAASSAASRAEKKGPASQFKRLFISSIHPDVDEHMLTPIFSAYGRIDNLSLLVDPVSKRSKGAAVVSFRDHVDAKKAIEQLDGVEIAGKAIKITVASDAQMRALADDSEATVALSMTPQARAELMMRLSRDSDLSTSTHLTQNYFKENPVFYILLSNLYDPIAESSSSATWKADLADDIHDECSKFGALVGRPVVLGNTQGEVLLQYSDLAASQLAVAALQGRWFGGRQIRASVISSQTYQQKMASSK